MPAQERGQGWARARAAAARARSKNARCGSTGACAGARHRILRCALQRLTALPSSPPTPTPAPHTLRPRADSLHEGTSVAAAGGSAEGSQCKCVLHTPGGACEGLSCKVSDLKRSGWTVESLDHIYMLSQASTGECQCLGPCDAGEHCGRAIFYEDPEVAAAKAKEAKARASKEKAEKKAKEQAAKQEL